MSYQYRTIGGIGVVTFAVTAGALPSGLSMSSSGLITGTTDTAEHDNAWTVTATDSDGNTAVLADNAYVLDMLGTPPNSPASTAYSYTLTGTEGTAPYTFALTTGSLPPGLSLATDGEISGTTGVDLDSYPFTVTITDSLGVDQVKPYTIQVTDGSAAVIKPYIIDWFTFDTADDVGGRARSALTTNEWANASNSAGMVSHPSGVKSEEGEASHPHKADGFNSTPSGTDWSWCGWVHVNSAVAATATIGFGEGTAFDITFLQGFALSTSGGGSTTGYIYAYDQGVPGYVNSTPTVISGSDRIFVILTMTGATKTYEMWANNVSLGTKVLATYPLSSFMERLSWREQGLAALATMQCKLDEVGTFFGLALTSAHRDYLWNGGNGKSWSEIVADALL